MTELLPSERVILAIDTFDFQEADRLASIAKEAGARYVKFGLELSSATSWHSCADLAADNGLDWVADAKLHDIPNTIAGAVKNFARFDHPPFGITVHASSGIEAMSAAQEQSDTIKMLGVTILTSIDKDILRIYKAAPRVKILEFADDIAKAGLNGIVASPREVRMLRNYYATAGMLMMVPGIRSEGQSTHDQLRVGTPAEVIRGGADLLVVGRQITQAEDPFLEFQRVVTEIESAA